MSKLKKISVVSGGFDPLHSGHIAYLQAASMYGDELWVCLNSDEWLQAKKGKAFMSFEERKVILEALACVNTVIKFDDEDGSCKKGLAHIAATNPDTNIIFCNGGDRTKENIPELSMEGVNFKFGVGGNLKKNSSSDILQRWTSPKEFRTWGYFTILFNNGFVKVKELSVSPHSGMSFQRHFKREEVWFIHSGSCKVYIQGANKNSSKSKILKPGDLLTIPLESWHQITNPFDEACKIIEIQHGSKVQEDDIERQFYYPQLP